MNDEDILIEVSEDNNVVSTSIDIAPIVEKIDMCVDLLFIQNIFIFSIIVFFMCKYAIGGYKNK